MLARQKITEKTELFGDHEHLWQISRKYKTRKSSQDILVKMERWTTDQYCYPTANTRAETVTFSYTCVKVEVYNVMDT